MKPDAPGIFFGLCALCAFLPDAAAQLVTSNPAGEKNVLQISTDTKPFFPSLAEINSQNATFYPENLAAIERELKKIGTVEVPSDGSKELSFGTSNQTAPNIKDAFKSEARATIEIKPGAAKKTEKSPEAGSE